MCYTSVALDSTVTLITEMRLVSWPLERTSKSHRVLSELMGLRGPAGVHVARGSEMKFRD